MNETTTRTTPTTPTKPTKPTKPYLGRGLIFAAWIAMAATAAAALVGTSYAGTVNLQLHVLVSLIATMILFFTHLWVLLYLAGTRRAILSTAAAQGLGTEIGSAVKRLFWRAVPWPLLGLAGLVALYLSGYSRMAERGPSWLHLAVSVACVVAQAVALGLAARSLAANEGWIRRVDAETSGAPAV